MQRITVHNVNLWVISAAQNMEATMSFKHVSLLKKDVGAGILQNP